MTPAEHTPSEVHTPLPDFMIWKCAGCGSPSKGRTKPCDCPTNVGYRQGPTGALENKFWAESDDARTPEERARDLLSAYPDEVMPKDVRTELNGDIAKALRANLTELAVIERVRKLEEALEYAEKDFGAILEWLLYPKVSLRDRITSAERIARPARTKARAALTE